MKRSRSCEAIRSKAESGKNIVTDGSSQLVHALLAHHLVDELHLFVYPLALGKGVADVDFVDPGSSPG